MMDIIFMTDSDDGKVSVAFYAGGGSAGGVLSTLSLMKETPDGKTVFRHYEVISEWVDPEVEVQ